MMQKLMIILHTKDGDLRPEHITDAKAMVEGTNPLRVTAYYADTRTGNVLSSYTITVNGDKSAAVDKAIAKLKGE
jgi:hypothetical protein